MIVLDTSVVSYIFNGDTRAQYYLDRIGGLLALISFQTLAEIWRGAYSNGWGERRKNELAHYLEQYEVVWSTPQLVEVCARLQSQGEAAGRRVADADAWIAATAVMLGCPLASHDGDFSGISSLSLIRNPAQ